MTESIWSREVLDTLERARVPGQKRVKIGNRVIQIPFPFPSPVDWRDHCLYSLLIDRFNNPAGPPLSPFWKQAQDVFQGGTFDGVRAQLPYLKKLGVSALLFSPVLKNCQYETRAYHGYGPQSFLEVEPRFASDPEQARRNPQVAERELRGLIDEAHARGMYVILDVVLNHAGTVFDYVDRGASAAWRSQPYPIRWRDALGQGCLESSEARTAESNDAAIRPLELCHEECFVRRGQAYKVGDFYSYRKLDTSVQAVRDTLIRIHKYLIAKYDLDGFRIDALHLLDEDFAVRFSDEIRNYASTIGKANFLLFGEITDTDHAFVRYVGRQGGKPGDPLGVDGMLDYPLFFVLPGVIKGFRPPGDLVHLFEHRKELHRGITGVHDEPGDHFVTFLENHDQHERFYYSPPGARHEFDDQVSLGLGCLFCLPGIPCLYYGSEQGLSGTEERYRDARSNPPPYEWVRESLWGKPNAFSRRHRFYRLIQQLSAIRKAEPALRYGRLYFRPLSCNGVEFTHSASPQGVVAFARIIDADEIVCLANPSTRLPWEGEVIVDFVRNAIGSTFELRFSNKAAPRAPKPVVEKASGAIAIREADGAVTNGLARAMTVRLKPMEIQILRRGYRSRRAALGLQGPGCGCT